MEHTGERMIPEGAAAHTFWEHVYRYGFATRFAAGKRVLDIACGEGYGTSALHAAGAGSVVGVDISPETCAHAQRKYGIDARVGSAEAIPLGDAGVDLVVSFETIEHVPHPGRFLAECARVLAPGGTLVMSTPVRGVYNVDNDGVAVVNPFHCSELTPEEFATLLATAFRIEALRGQQPVNVSRHSLENLSVRNSRWLTRRGFERARLIARGLRGLDLATVPPHDAPGAIERLIASCGRGRRTLALANPYAMRPTSMARAGRFEYLTVVARKR